MTAADLTAMFQAAGVKPGAIRKWARENYGVEIRDTTISRHKSGDQRILPFAEIVYKIFFKSISPITVDDVLRAKEIIDNAGQPGKN